MSREPSFRQEVPFLLQTLPHRLATTPPPPHHASSARSFSLSGKASGAIFCTTHDDPHHGLHWQIENGAAATLELRPFSMVSQAHTSPTLQLVFDVQLFPSIAISRSSDDLSGTVTVVGLLSSDALFFHQLSLHHPLHAAHPSEAMAAVDYCDLSGQLGPHGPPTALAAVGGIILIGCSDGLVLGFSALARHEATPLFELQASSWGLNRLISGIFYRTQQPSVVTLLCMHASPFAAPADKDKHLTFVIYDDCTLRSLHLARGQVVFNENLALTPATSSSQPPPLDGASNAPKRLVLTFATLCSCTADRLQSQQEHVLVASFESGIANATSHSIFTLAVSAAGRLAIQDKHELASLSSSAVVLSACMSQPETVWVLVREHGLTQVLGYSRTGQVCRLTQLQEQFNALVIDDAAQDDVVMLELWEDVLASYRSSEFGAEAQVLAHVLAPSSLCRFSLKDTLACLGAQLTMSEAETCSLEELGVYIRGAVQTLHRRNPNATLCQSWLLFLRSYREIWSRRHVALSLYAHPGSRQLGCVRGGGMLTMLRGSQEAEVLWQCGRRSGLATGTDLRSQVQCGALRDVEMQAVHASVQAVASSLGPLCMDAFVGLLASGVQPCRELARKFTALWLDCPPGGTGRAHDDVVRAQLSRWRQQRRLLLLQLGQRLGAVDDPVAALQRYVGLVGSEPPSAPSRCPAAAAAGLWAGPVVAVVEQQAYAQCCNLRDCLLLASAMLQLSAVGTAPLSAGQLQRLEATLAPQLEAQLQQAALCYWLSRTPATSGRAGMQLEPAVVALEHLTLGGVSGTAGQPQHGHGDVALAAKLLPLALPGLGLQPSSSGESMHAGNIEAAAERLAAWLRHGSAAVAPAPAAASWVLELGFRLFERRERSALLPLSRLAGALAVQDGSADLLRGLSLACGLGPVPASLGPEALSSTRQRRSEVVEEATSCFFRAVSNLTSARKQSLPSIAQALRHVVTDLDDAADDADASQPAHPHQHQHPHPQQQALEYLRLYELIMMLFEREGAPEGALTFAHAALQQLSLLVRAAPPGSECHDASWLPLEGRLWSNAFAYDCALGRFEGAYAAVVANPLPERGADCLRRLVHELCQRGQLAVLCGLPLAGTLGAVPLVQEVVQALQRRACNADLLLRPQPYRVLHDFLVARSDLRGAARAMLALARRLRGEGPAGAASEALLAYEAAINALSLVKEPDAWLDLSEPWIMMHARPVRPLPLLFAHDRSDQHGDGSGGGGPPRGPDADVEPQEAALGVLTLPQLRREYLLLRCAMMVAAQQPGMAPLQQWAGEDEVFSELLQGGATEAAITLAHACFSGTALSSALARALASLATKCGRLQLNDAELGSGSHEGLGTPGLSEPEQREVLMGQGQLGSRAAPHWLLLRQLLQRYEGARSADGLRVHGGCLRGVVADAVLRVDRRLQLPPWLLDLFREDSTLGPDTWSLLGVYLSHDRLADAVELVKSNVDDWSRRDPRQRRRLAAVWLPHHKIGALRLRLSSEVERGSEGCGPLLLQRLDAAMQAHLELAAHDSDVDVGSLDPSSGAGAGLGMLLPANGSPAPAWSSWSQGGSWQGTDGSGPESGQNLDLLSPPPRSLLWLPPVS